MAREPRSRTPKVLIVALTDIAAAPDDQISIVRLPYSNQFDL